MRSRAVVAVVSAAVVLSLVASTRGYSVVTEERSSRQKRSGSRWSQWFNSDRPWNGQGDFETASSIGKFQQICGGGEEAVGAQCRVAGTNDTFDSTTTAFVKDLLLQACSSQGLVCLNSQQLSALCDDYEVRFLCQDMSSDDGSSGSLFPTFDFKIYIVLAVVPLVIVSLRIIWSCCCRDRFKRGTPLQRHQQGQNSASTLSTSSSQTSFDPALANPPPAYADLFGTPRGSSGGRVFSISGGECPSCGKCMHHGHVEEFRSVGLVSGPRHSPLLSVQETGAVDASAAEAQAADNDEVFTAPSSSSDSSGVDAAVTSQTDPASQPSEGVIITRSASSGSFMGAVGLPLTQIPAQAPSSSSSNTPCACACHRGQSGHLNMSFQWEPSDVVDTRVPGMYPGMHKPVFTVSRIASEASFTSLTEPPDYDEALEILKKSGLILEQEKVAV